MTKHILLGFAISLSLFTTGQVHVRDEPRHHNIFENEFIRILDVHLGPGDTTLYHLHNTPSVFIVFTNTNVGSQLKGKQPQKGANVSGEISYDSINIPRTHRVWNEDTSWFHVMDVELTSRVQEDNMTVLQIPSLKLLFNEQQVNGYSIELKNGKALQLPASATGYLLVSNEKSAIEYKIKDRTQTRIMKEGHYIWIEAEQDFSLSSKDSQTVNFLLLQLK